jgi:type IV pilus assembly protein PilP
MIARRTIGVGLLMAALAGCTGSGDDELQQWMTEQRSQTKAQIAPIPAPKKFLPQDYIQDVGAEPFSNGRLLQALRQESGKATANAALVAPELSRRKEPLESMPLDSIKMVGSLNKAGQLVGIVRVDNLLYQVRPGNYLGPNYGRITKVSETEIVLREIVQDAGGEWIERAANLQLQERAR